MVNWSRATCKMSDTEMFFDKEREDDAVNVCKPCPIKLECLAYALIHEPYGVWGGLTEAERKKINAPRHRVKCPGCHSYLVDEVVPRMEFCRQCGLSWRV